MDRNAQVSDVSINTLAVEVKVMKIGNRQVTHSVFKQLEQDDILYSDGTLLGEPLGRVNYCADCVWAKSYPHLHIVFQRGGKLYRGDLISPRYPMEDWYYRELNKRASLKARDYYYYKMVYQGWLPEWPRSHQSSLVLTVESSEVVVSLDMWVQDFLRYPQEGNYYERTGKEKMHGILKESLGTLNSLEVNEDSLYQRVQLDIGIRESYWGEYRNSYSRLAQLDQLFIAV